MSTETYLVIRWDTDSQAAVMAPGTEATVVRAVELFNALPWQALRDGVMPPRVYLLTYGQTDRADEEAKDFGLTELHAYTVNRGTPDAPDWRVEWRMPDGTLISRPMHYNGR